MPGNDFSFSTRRAGGCTMGDPGSDWLPMAQVQWPRSQALDWQELPSEPSPEYGSTQNYIYGVACHSLHVAADGGKPGDRVLVFAAKETLVISSVLAAYCTEYYCNHGR